jgi:DNA polymerase III delta prime subunit
MPVQSMDEIEEFWDAIRLERINIKPIEEDSGPESVINDAITEMVTKFPTLLYSKCSPAIDHLSPDINSRGNFVYYLTMILTEFSRELLKTLMVEQRKKDASVLIQLFLEVPSMPAFEVKEFLRALPRTIIDRILTRLIDSNGSRGTGLQALLTLEALYRDSNLDHDYVLERDSDGKLIISFQLDKHRNDGPVSFRLRELFSL